MEMLQLELFEEDENDPEFQLKKMKYELAKMKDQMEKTRRSQYARIGELQKMYQEVAHEFTMLKMNICKGRVVI
jgi:hypothetical protein